MAITSRCLAVERVILAMRERLDRTLTLHEMAEIAHLSPFHFVRVFRHVVGVPPGEFRGALRLEEAKRLLLTTGLSVTDVCFEVGYRSLGTFTTRFTQLVGVPPGRLRRVHHLPDAIGPYLEPPRHQDGEASPDRAIEAGLAGRISAPGLSRGLIFVGLFPAPLPQSRPVACTLVTAPGSFHIASVPDGRYHVLSAALPFSADPLALLLPGSTLCVGSGSEPILVRGGRTAGQVDLTLRPPRLTDPPLVVAPPLLLAERRPVSRRDSV